MRIFIVSNRLPLTAVKGNKLKFKESVDGLVSGLSSYISSLKGSSLNYGDCRKSRYLEVFQPHLRFQCGSA